MIKIVDNTLATFNDHLPEREDILKFCMLLTDIGVDYIEISKEIYEILEKLPEEYKFYMRVRSEKEIPVYPGIYRYLIRHGENGPNTISEFQVNDVREIHQLRSFTNREQIRIVGLDDLMNHDYKEKIKQILLMFHGSNIIFCPENTYFCAAALAVEWILNGGQEITTSFAGKNNKAPTEEVIMALRLTVRHKPNKSLASLPLLKECFEKMSGTKIKGNKAIIGENIFKVESGLHIDGIKKNPANYEPFSPEIVGKERSYVIGKHSGKRAVMSKLIDYRISILSEEAIEKILNKVQIICSTETKSLSDEEFLEIANEVIVNERKKKNRR